MTSHFLLKRCNFFEDVFQFLAKQFFNDVSKIPQYRANDASNDVHRPPLEKKQDKSCKA